VNEDEGRKEGKKEGRKKRAEAVALEEFHL
jgi:hypothetical protein